MRIEARSRARGRLSSALCAAGVAITIATLMGCSDPETEPDEVTPPPADPTVDCSVPAKNRRLYDLMKDAYLWYDRVPAVDPASFESPEALLDALVYKDIDRWSHVALKQVSEAYYEEGRRIGLGIRMKYDADDAVRVALVSPESPATDVDVALERGDKILAINGKTIQEIEDEDLWDTILGPDDEGVVTTMQIERVSGGAVSDVTMTKRSFVLSTTPISRVFPAGDRTVGYVYFDRFLETSVKELDGVFASFKEGGVNELVLDLRYNGGGLVNVALHLGDLITGKATEGKLFSKILHNDKHAGWNRDQVFATAESALNLKRVFIIATSATASSSELLINSLFPYVEVKIIGGATYGKPVGSGAWTDCDLEIRPISFRMLNAEGRGDYYNGISQTCIAGDDLGLPLGDEAEASLAEVLQVMRSGSCTVSPSAPLLDTAKAGARREIPWRGLRAEIGAI